MKPAIGKARMALVMVPLLLSGALLATLLSTYVAVRGTLETLDLGQGDAILDSLSPRPGEHLEEEFLDRMLETHREEGLRCIVIFDRSAKPRAVAGECLEASPEALQTALFAAGRDDPMPVGRRIRMTRASSADLPRSGSLAPGELLTREPMMVEFEPLMRRDLERDALRSLGIGGIASLALVAVAIALWRFSLRQERLQVERERERRLASLGEMAAILAHEIRNPLTSMKGHSQLLAERLEEGSLEREKADRVVREAVRLEQLSRDLLSFIRSERIERQSVDPLAVVEGAAQDVDPGRIKIESAQAPDRWSLDPRLLRQALANLLRNAVQATPAEHFATIRLASEGDRIVFEVRDRGNGVTEKDRASIFEPFYTTRLRGTGLGLSVARRIVTLHDGEISTSNHPDGGAVFRVAIPRAAKAA